MVKAKKNQSIAELVSKLNKPPSSPVLLPFSSIYVFRNKTYFTVAVLNSIRYPIYLFSGGTKGPDYFEFVQHSFMSDI